MDDPRTLVEAFIADYFRWNQEAYQRYESPHRLRLRGQARDKAHRQAMEAAREEYAALLARYCRPGFEGQSISFGSSSMHDPGREVVVSVKPRGDRCVVRTRSTEVVAGTELVNDYEYRLTRSEDRWYLESLKTVHEDGKFECL